LRSLDGHLVRVGLARDRHPFGPGEPLALGGIDIPGPRLFGHSDGDVALHAVGGALLSAAGLGDLGRAFPSDLRTPAGIASSRLVREVVDRLASAGVRPAAVDVEIEAGRPRLAPYLDEIAAEIARLVELDASRVSVSASTGNLGGDTGAGRAIEATAIAVVERR
jgi:2-C-methyl-D-erythritol 2,4-cyclodiphosphate synthase